MQFKFPRITLPLDLGEYHESANGQVVHVWVNPPRSVKREREDLIRQQSQDLATIVKAGQDPAPAGKRTGLPKLFSIFARNLETKEQKALAETSEKIFAWLSQIWSQHEDRATHLTADDVRRAYEEDPAFYRWLVRRTIEMIETFRNDTKKASRPPQNKQD